MNVSVLLIVAAIILAVTTLPLNTPLQFMNAIIWMVVIPLILFTVYSYQALPYMINTTTDNPIYKSFRILVVALPASSAICIGYSMLGITGAIMLLVVSSIITFVAIIYWFSKAREANATSATPPIGSWAPEPR